MNENLPRPLNGGGDAAFHEEKSAWPQCSPCRGLGGGVSLLVLGGLLFLAVFLGARPEDNEGSIGGTAALFSKRGDRVKFVSATDGSKGHFAPQYISDPESLATRRSAEARKASSIIGAEYESLGIPDGEVYVTPA